MLNIPEYKEYAGETKIALMDNSSLAFMHELSQRSYPSDGILSVYDLILIPKWVMEEIEDSTYRSTYVEQLQAQGYPIRWIDETKYGAFVNDEDVNLYYIVEAAVSRVSELMRFLRRKVKTEDLIDLPSAEEWMNRLYDEWPIHGRTLSTGRTLKKNAGEISLTIVENAHEAIILKSDFEKVQARREQNKERRERAMARSKATREKCYNHLSGMVYCGCCRRNMTFERRVHGTVKETHYGVFICKRKKNTTPCAYHAVPEKMLMMVAMDQIHHLVSTMCEEEKLVKDMMRGSNLDSARSIKLKENSILFRIQEAEERRLRLYEDYKAEILDEDEYSQLKEHYIAEKQRLEHELQKQRQRALELEKRIKICDAQMERMRGILNQNEFDEELVHELIKRIYVGMDNSVEVEFKCSDPYQEVLAIMSEVQNE